MKLAMELLGKSSKINKTIYFFNNNFGSTQTAGISPSYMCKIQYYMCIHYLTLKDILDLRHKVAYKINQIIPCLCKFNINITILIYCNTEESRLYDFFNLWTLKCFPKSPDETNDFWHLEQLKGFSPVWVLSWICKETNCEKALEQWEQL